MFGHDGDWWTALSAIGQLLGALATFLAVLVSLWIVRSDRSLRGRGDARILVSFAGDGSPGIYQVGFQVHNVGYRDFLVQSISWRVGWFRHGPKPIRHEYAIATSGTGRMFENRWVKASLSELFCLTVRDMKRGLVPDDERGRFFQRKVQWLGWAPIRAYANISGGHPIPLRIAPELAQFLRTAQHADTTEG